MHITGYMYFPEKEMHVTWNCSWVEKYILLGICVRGNTDIMGKHMLLWCLSDMCSLMTWETHIVIYLFFQVGEHISLVECVSGVLHTQVHFPSQSRIVWNRLHTTSYFFIGSQTQGLKFLSRRYLPPLQWIKVYCFQWIASILAQALLKSLAWFI